MNKYIGTKVINAKPMTRQEYNDFRGWQLPSDENGSDDGFLVEYVDGGKNNTNEFPGYVSWSPKEVFEKSYRDVSGGMTFGDAILLLKQGSRVSRQGWNGKGMYLALQPGSVIEADQARGGVALCLAESGEETIVISPHIDMKAADGTCIVGWLASQTDILAEDWVIVD